MNDFLICLLVAQVLTVVGLGIVARARLKRDPRIGKPIWMRQDSGGLKPILFATQVGLIIICLGASAFPKMHAIVALYGSFMLTWLAPGSGDYALGEEGFFQGWIARRFDELDEWQLEREQGRVRLCLDGHWLALPLPRDKFNALRSALLRVVPDREHSAD